MLADSIVVGRLPGSMGTANRPPKKNGVNEGGDDHAKNSLHLPRRYTDP